MSLPGAFQLPETGRTLAEEVLAELRKYKGNPIGLELAIFVELDFAYTEPAVRGDERFAALVVNFIEGADIRVIQRRFRGANGGDPTL